MTDIKIFRLPIVTCGARLVFGFSIMAVMMFGLTAEAQKFDLEAYLKKIDVNRNGKLEENEMSDRTKGWIGKMGMDTNKTVSISKVLAKVAKDRRDGEKKKASDARAASRKVPGFGAEARETTGVTSFGVEGASAAKSTEKYSDSVMERVRSTLERYDRNKNGVLDKSEIQDARWGSPSPDESDKNKDGKLSRDELAARYGDREKYYRSRESSRVSSSRSSSNKEAEDRARRERERERFRNSGRTSSSSRPSSSSTRSSSSSTSSADSQAKYKKYAESLIGNYDKDKDGKLNKDEIKQMRRPPIGADTDKDGFITQSELLDSLSGANKTSTSGSEKTEKNSGDTSSKTTRKEYSSYKSKSTGSRGGSSSSFDKLDANADRHVHMHEFSSDWDEEKIAQFYAKDKNGDGVITLREWTGQ